MSRNVLDKDLSNRQRRQTDLYHAMTWPSLSYVAEDHKGRVIGYILAKMCAVLQVHSMIATQHIDVIH